MAQHTWGWEMDPRLEPGVTCPGHSRCVLLEHKGYNTCQRAGQCQAEDEPDLEMTMDPIDRLLAAAAAVTDMWEQDWDADDVSLRMFHERVRELEDVIADVRKELKR